MTTHVGEDGLETTRPAAGRAPLRQLTKPCAVLWRGRIESLERQLRLGRITSNEQLGAAELRRSWGRTQALVEEAPDAPEQQQSWVGS